MGRSDGEQRKVQGSQVKIKRMTHLIRQLIKPQGDWAMEPWLSFYKPLFLRSWRQSSLSKHAKTSNHQEQIMLLK